MRPSERLEELVVDGVGRASYVGAADPILIVGTSWESRDMEIVVELQKFNSFLSELAALLNGSGPPPEAFKDDSGKTLKGWRYNTQDKKGEERYAGSQYLGGWGGYIVDFLSTGGELYTYSFEWGEEKPSDEWINTTSHSLLPVSTERLAGKGKPFSQAKRELEKLALQCVGADRPVHEEPRPEDPEPKPTPVQNPAAADGSYSAVEPEGEAWNAWAIEEFRRDVRRHYLDRE